MNEISPKMMDWYWWAGTMVSVAAMIVGLILALMAWCEERRTGDEKG